MPAQVSKCDKSGVRLVSCKRTQCEYLSDAFGFHKIATTIMLFIQCTIVFRIVSTTLIKLHIIREFPMLVQFTCKCIQP